MRLYRVLGKRTGHEQPLPRTAEDRPALAAVPRTVDATPEPREVVSRNIEPRAEAGLRAIVAAESGFDVNQFIEGAQGAYRMVLEAFWKGDEDELGYLAEDDVPPPLPKRSRRVSPRAKCSTTVSSRSSAR